MLSQEDISGTRCPFCGNEDVYWHEVTIEDNTALQRGTCTGCDESWVAIYDFVGVAFDPDDHPEPDDRIIVGTPEEQSLAEKVKELEAENAALKEQLEALV